MVDAELLLAIGKMLVHSLLHLGIKVGDDDIRQPDLVLRSQLSNRISKELETLESFVIN
jgi:hypothetical protein